MSKYDLDLVQMHLGTTHGRNQSSTPGQPLAPVFEACDSDSSQLGILQ